MKKYPYNSIIIIYYFIIPMKKLLILSFLLGASLIINQAFASTFEAYNGNIYDWWWKDWVFHITYLGANTEVIIFEKRTVEKITCKDKTTNTPECIVNKDIRKELFNMLLTAEYSCIDLAKFKSLVEQLQKDTINTKVDKTCTTGSKTTEYQRIVPITTREGTPKSWADID